LDGALKLYFDRRDMDIHSVYEGFDFISFTTYKAIETDEYVTTSLGANIQFDARPLPDARLVFGLDAGLSDLDAEQLVLNDSTGEVSETQWFPVDTTAGLYAGTDWRPWGSVTVVGSARYDWSQAYGSRVSPSLGLVYDLGRNARIKSSFGQAFRAPTLNDLYWPESPFAGGNPEVKPEEGFGGELRAEYEPIRSVGVRASVFTREVEDLIQWSPDQDWVWRPSNVNEFSSRGVELELRLMPVADAIVRGHFSYISCTQRNEETVAYDEYSMPVYGMVERRAAFRPEMEGSMRASYKAPFGFDFRLGLDYTGERVSYWQEVDTTGGFWNPITKEKWLDDRLLANAGIGFYLGPQYFFARVENIFDKRYREQFGYDLLDRDYPGPGRTFSYGMKLTLN
jgi:outer membrane receptor protein involved in Fe transport